MHAKMQEQMHKNNEQTHPQAQQTAKAKTEKKNEEYIDYEEIK
jgi:hypothetical protein